MFILIKKLIFPNQINEEVRALIANFGSVGQPRNGFNTADYGIVKYRKDVIDLCFHTVPYNIGKTKKKMEREGMHTRHIERLAR